MARKFLTHLDLARNELQNAVVHNLPSAPGTPVKGMMYYNSTGGDDTLYWWNGTTWMSAKGGPFTPIADFSMANFKITNLGTPTAATDAANKTYVDGVAQGLDFKGSVRCATTANGTLATAFANAQVIDGTTLTTGNRILIKNQTTASENGIYTVNASGAPTRSVDTDTTGEISPGAITYVEVGTLNGGQQWICSATNATPWVVNVSTSTWTIYFGVSTVQAGAGLTATSNVLAVGAGTGITVGADTVGLTNMNALTIKGNNTGSAAAPTDLTGTNVTAMLDLFSNVARGLAPASGAATAGMFLSAAGAFAAPDYVWVGTGAPTDPTVEFWYDTDDPITGGAYSANVGNGAANPFVVTHNLGTRDVIVQVYANSAPWDTVECDVERTDVNNVSLRFTVAAATAAYRAVISA